jgi:hypothetical protein
VGRLVLLLVAAWLAFLVAVPFLAWSSVTKVDSAVARITFSWARIRARA